MNIPKLDQKGQSLAEYAFILALVALAAVVVLTGIGQGITSQVSQVSDALTQ